MIDWLPRDSPLVGHTVIQLPAVTSFNAAGVTSVTFVVGVTSTVELPPCAATWAALPVTDVTRPLTCAWPLTGADTVVVDVPPGLPDVGLDLFDESHAASDNAVNPATATPAKRISRDECELTDINVSPIPSAPTNRVSVCNLTHRNAFTKTPKIWRSMGRNDLTYSGQAGIAGFGEKLRNCDRAMRRYFVVLRRHVGRGDGNTVDSVAELARQPTPDGGPFEPSSTAERGVVPTSGIKALASSATLAAACATVVFASACGVSAPQASHAPSPSHASGKVKIRYSDAQTPEAQRGRQLMRDAKLLEDLAAYVEDSVLLPSDMAAVAKQCDAVNDFYNPASNELMLCYESIQHSEQNFAANGKPNPAIAALDAETSGFYHELGHAILHIYDLAFTGREEDVADQLSAFMLLTPGADGKPYPNGVRIATDTAQDWKLSAKEAGDANELPFWDGHPMDLQRMYNWECWIYGSDPRANTGIVTSGDLPEDRAGKCEKEFQNMARAWQQMLGPYLRKPS